MAINWKEVGVKVGGSALGAIGTRMIIKVLPRTIPKMWVGLGAICVGALLPTVIKSNFIEEVGSGMIAVGAQELATSYGFGIAGMEDEGYDGGYSVQARNMAIEQANNQVSEYIAAAEELEQELEEAVNGLEEESAMVGMPDDDDEENMIAENMIAEDLAYAM